MKKIKIPFRNLWILSVMAGIVMGTIWANLLGSELLEQVGYFNGFYQAGREIGYEEQWQMWQYVVRQRIWEAGFAGLLSMTSIAIPGYILLSFALGFVMAVVITVFTLHKGCLGILYWLVSVLPHGLCYLVVWGIFVAAIEERQGMKKITVWLVVIVLIASGSFLEVWVNPWFLTLLRM